MAGPFHHLRLAGQAGIIAVAALLVAGCSLNTTEIDAGQAEQFVKGAFPKPARSVSCPGGVKVKKGGTFTCKAVDATGKRYEVTLHMVDGNGRVTVGKGDFKLLG